MPLRKPLAMFIQNQRTMIKRGWCQSERAVEKDLPRGGQQQVRAAHDFGDLHGGIVHDDRELICGNVVLPPDDKIAKVFSGDELLRAEMAVGERNSFAIRNTETITAVRNAECEVRNG